MAGLDEQIQSASISGIQHGAGVDSQAPEMVQSDDNADTRPPGSRFLVTGETEKHYKRFALTGREITLKITTPPDTADPVTWLEEAVRDIHAYVLSGASIITDYIGFSIDAPTFVHGSAGLSFRPARDCKHEDLWGLIYGVTQSATDFCIDDAFTVTVSRVSVPVGSGRNKLTHEDVRKRSLLEIPRDNLCLPRALVVARAYAGRVGAVTRDASEPPWDVIRRAPSRAQKSTALELCRRAGVVVIPEHGCGIPEIIRFQQYFTREGLAVMLYDFNTFGRGEEPMYNGSREIAQQGNRIVAYLNIMYYPRGGHYKPILNLTAAAATCRFCIPCNIAYRNINDHKCVNRCTACVATPQCDPQLPLLRCTGCRRWFFGENCLRNHRLIGSFNTRRSVCDTLQICRCCDRFTDRSRRSHVCGKTYCRTCGSTQPLNHRCYIRPLEKPAKDTEYLFIFYDFETQQCVKMNEDTVLHVPNLCVAQQVCTVCIHDPDIKNPCVNCGLVREFIFRRDPVKEFVDFATRDVKKFKKIICLAHNARGFDAQFILRHLVECDRDPPRITLNGTKIVLMETGKTRFLDSLAYMPMSLAALPKAFGLPVESRKGIFPHLFNTPENQNYVGPLPPTMFYSPDSMSTTDRSLFFKWYEEACGANYIFDFDRELVAYCRSDVDILRRACTAFRDIFLGCGSVCPFSQSTTIASACSVVFRQNFLQPNTIGILPAGGYRLADKQSGKAIKWLVWMERELGRDVCHAGRGREYRIPETGRLVDGYYEDADGVRNVLEFHGCYWHGCERCFPLSRRKTLAVRDDTMIERLEETRAKTAKMRELGYRVTEMWECSFDELMKNDSTMRDHVDQHPLCGEGVANPGKHLNPRDAFFGGRTGNARRYHETRVGEEIRYVDVCSLYPWVCKNGRYPIGHPRILVGDECSQLIGADNADIDAVDGLVKCDVLPPRDLYHPVLPLRMHGKLMFPLCRSCCEHAVQSECHHEAESERLLSGTWVSEELKKAVSLGYRITRVYEIWHYEITVYDKVSGQGGLFAPYIDTFLKIKQEASGWPAECIDEPSRERYIAEYERVEGIRLDRDKIEKNAGLRSVSKLCLNSFWGKFGQRENLPHTEVITERQRLLELLTDPECELLDILPVTERVLYARWSHSAESVTPSPLASVIHAAYTTAQARLKLYGYLEKLGRRVLYYDTDSVIYVRGGNEHNEYEPPLGNFLGDLTDELGEYGPGSYINAFVCAGPKFYAFTVKRGGTVIAEVCKVKGVTLNHQTRLKINFNSVRAMVVSGGDPIRVERRAIRRTALHQVVTRTESKICRPVQSKRRPGSPGSFDTLPYGYNDTLFENYNDII